MVPLACLLARLSLATLLLAPCCLLPSSGVLLSPPSLLATSVRIPHPEALAQPFCQNTTGRMSISLPQKCFLNCPPITNTTYHEISRIIAFATRTSSKKSSFSRGFWFGIKNVLFFFFFVSETPQTPQKSDESPLDFATSAPSLRILGESKFEIPLSKGNDLADTLIQEKHIPPPLHPVIADHKAGFQGGGGCGIFQDSPPPPRQETCFLW